MFTCTDSHSHKAEEEEEMKMTPSSSLQEPGGSATIEYTASPAEEEGTALHNMDTSKVYMAIAAGNIEFLKAAHRSETVRFVSPADNTMLHIYIISQSKSPNRLTMVQKLLSALKSVSLFKETTTTAPSSRSKIVQDMLKEWPSLLQKANGKGDTPLHMAARHGEDDIVQVLIDCAKNNLHVAGEEKEDMEAGQVDDKSRQSAVWKMLHETNADGETALHQAVRYGHTEVARVLIGEDDPSFSYDVNEDGETPLYMAAERSNMDVIGLILERYTFPAYKGPNGRTALHAAALMDDYEAVEAIPKKRGLEFLTTKVDDQGQTPLHCNPSVLNWLEDKSATYMADKDGNTPLHIAAREGACWAVEVFIKRCPECFEMVDKEGRNALHLAIRSGVKRKVDLILEHELFSDLLKQKDNNGNTPLHLLATCPNYWPHLLKDHRFDRMAFNKDNLTPLDAVLSNKRAHLKMERRRRASLVQADTYRGNRILANSDTMNVKENRKSGQVSGKNEYDEDNLIDERQSQLVVAALIATVTFAAGFTLPGGYIQDKGPHQGYAVLTKNAAFVAFVISDTFGLVLSCAAVFIHLLIAMDNYKEKKIVRKLFSKALPFTLLAIVAMVIAFITGTYAVLGHSPALAISASSIGSVFFCLLGYLVEEARESTSFPIFRWAIYGLRFLVRWSLLLLIAIPLTFVFRIADRIQDLYYSSKKKIKMLHRARH